MNVYPFSLPGGWMRKLRNMGLGRKPAALKSGSTVYLTTLQFINSSSRPLKGSVNKDVSVKL